MKNLKTLSNELPPNSMMSKEALLNMLGGRRYTTDSYSNTVHLCRQLWKYGIRYSISQHDGKYCIEW